MPFPTRAVDKATTTLRHEFTKLKGQAREDWVITQVCDGLVPDFMRAVHPVTKNHSRAFVRTGSILCEVLYECLCLGVDKDYFIVPVSFETAVTLAEMLEFVIPNWALMQSIHSTGFGKSPSFHRTLAEKTDSKSMLEVSACEEAYRTPNHLMVGHRYEFVFDDGVPYAAVLDGVGRLSELVPVDPSATVLSTTVRFVEPKAWDLTFPGAEGNLHKFMKEASLWK